MKSILIGVIAIAGVLVVPASSMAATYMYVDVNGMVKTQEANSAAEALTKPMDIALTSGVMIVSYTNTPMAISPGVYVNL